MRNLANSIFLIYNQEVEPNNQQGEEKSGGAVFGSIMIILILVVGGIFLVKEKIKIAKELKIQQEQFQNQAQNSTAVAP